MTDKSDFEKLSAYNDGEISPEMSSKLNQTLTEQEELRQSLLQMKNLDNDVKAVFDDMLAGRNFSDHINAIDQAFSKKQNSLTSWTESRWFPAIAASFLAVSMSAGIGFFAFDRYTDRVISEIASARIVENSKLATLLQDTLETKVSGSLTEYTDPAKNVSFKIVPNHTYKSNSGHWCRQFSETIETFGMIEYRKGLACREKKGEWRRLTTTIEGELGGKL